MFRRITLLATIAAATLVSACINGAADDFVVVEPEPVTVEPISAAATE